MGKKNAIDGFGNARDYTKLSRKRSEILLKRPVSSAWANRLPNSCEADAKDEAAIDHVIVNGAECEPYLTSDYSVMMERPEQIIGGLKVILQLFDNAKGIIGIENNKPEAIKKLTEMVKTSRELRYVRFSPNIRRAASVR